MTLRKTLTRTVLPLTALLLMALLVAACVAPVETGAADMMDDEMKVLTVAVAQEPTHLEATLAAAETNCNGCLNVVETLVTRNFSTGEIIPLLATEWERIDDNTIQFQLRQGVTFHDGSPLNGEAVATSINYMWEADLVNTLTGFVGGVLSAEAVDEYSVNVSAADPDPILLEKMYFVAITSAKQIQEEPDTYSTNLIGTGPYMLDEWNRGESITYVVNPDWWGHDNPDAAGGSVSFDRLTWRFLPEDTVRAAAAQAGEVHIAQFVTPDQCNAAMGDENLRCASVASVETMFARMGNKGLFEDIRVRRALNLAIDKEQIVNTLLGGAATITGQIVNATATGHNPNLEPYPYDADAARALLEAAAADGVDVGEEFTLASRQGLHAGHVEVLQAVAAMLSDVGLNPTVAVMPPDTFNPAFSNNWADLVGQPHWVAIHLHGNEILDVWYSYANYFVCGGAVSLYCNDDMDALVGEGGALSGEARDMKLQEAGQFAYDDVAYGLIAHMDLAYLVSEDLNWSVKLDHRLQAKEMSPK
jgi:peptide/nickel transport system substrate-binding protein